MPSLIKDKFETVVAATISLASIATAAGRISTQIDNSTIRAPFMLVYWKIRAGGSAPTAGNPYTLYLIRGDADATTQHVDEGLGLTDAALTTKPNAAQVVDVIPAIATINQIHYSSAWIQNIGPKFSFAFWNESGQTINATGGDHWVRYILVTPEAQ